MTLREVCEKLLEIGSTDPAAFASYYRENMEIIERAVQSSDLAKMDFHLGQGADRNSLRFAVVFAPFASVFLRKEGSGQILLLGGPNRPVRVSVPSILRALERQAPSLTEVERRLAGLSAGLWFRTDDTARRLVDELSPLIGAGRLLIRPSKILMMPVGKNSKGGTAWAGLDVDPDSPLDSWQVLESAANEGSLPLKEGEGDREMERLLFQVTVPYLRGVSFPDLARILDDEQDHLADLRRALMQAVQAVKREPSSGMSIRRDLLDPELEKISRRFHTIASTHGLRVGGAVVSTAVASLVAFTGAGLTAGLAALLSAAGLGSVAKEVSDLLQERASVKESPFYLLWRLKRLSR